jgi:hypothetical protein
VVGQCRPGDADPIGDAGLCAAAAGLDRKKYLTTHTKGATHEDNRTPPGEPRTHGENVTPQQRPLARRVQARAMRMVNVPMRRILALPFPTPLSRRLMLLTYRGRRSGKQYRQPLSYVGHDDTLLTPGGGKWTLNLVNGRAEHVRLGGRDVILYPELVSPSTTSSTSSR